MALDWAEPRALWGLLLVLPVVAAHLYRRRRRRLEVAFVPLLRESVAPVRALGAWRRLAEGARLLLRTLALACLVLALAGPRPAEAQVPPTDLVVVLDLDATTSAVESRGREGVETRLDRAVDLARALILAHDGGRTGLVAAGAVPRVLVAPTEDRAPSLAALDDVAAIASEPVAADLVAAIAAAAPSEPAARPRRVVLVTSRPLPAGAPEGVVAVGAGAASDDQGFSDLSVAPSADGTARVVRVVVSNRAAEERARRVRAGFRGAPGPLEPREVRVPAGGTAEVRIVVLPPRGGGCLVLELEGDDAWPGNDVASAWLDSGTRPSVLVVHGGAPRPFVSAVLDALGDGVDRAASGFVAVGDLARAARRDVTIVDGVALPAGALYPGGWVFLAPLPAGGAAPFSTGRAVKDPLVWRTETSHPLLRGVDLSTAYVVRAVTLTAPGARPLAWAEGEPVVAEGEDAGVRWLAFGLDPDGSDLPLRAALPVLLRNAIRRLGAAPLAPLPAFVREGQALRPRAPWPGPLPVAVAFEHLGRTFPSRRERAAGRGAARPAVAGAPWTLETFDAEGPARDVPPGGPWLVTVSSKDGAAHATVAEHLDPPFDVTPARPPTAAPPPAPPRAPRGDRPWTSVLLAVAGATLLADALLGARRPGKLAPPRGSA